MGGRIRGLILVAALIAVGVFAGSAISQWWEVPGSAATAAGFVRESAVAAPTERVRVEVLNAGGRPNLARSATDALRGVGFDVVYFGNADSFGRDSSVVLDRVGRTEHARAVADALGIRKVLSEPDSTLFVDVSVVLGTEWQPAAAPPVASTPEPPWWDPRRYLPDEEAPARPGAPRASGSMANPTGSGGDR
jgi:hypothetical protein